MGLAKYRAKRNFSRTPEPRGKRAAPATKPRFFIQKHAATRLHYDLRLELDGVLKSWAVPHGPSLNPDVRTLAVAVEDHPLDYGTFEGIIPQGEYGGGTVMLWDRGTWEVEGDGLRNYKKGKLRFTLHGEKLRGAWTLVRMSGQASDGGKNWLLIKRRDSAARPPKLSDITVSEPNSVTTGRTLEEIAAAGRGEGKRPPVTLPRSTLNVATLPGAVRRQQPKTLAPQLATVAVAPPRGDDWLHEVKLDGYRIIAILREGEARLISRNGHDWTDRFPDIAQAVASLQVPRAILDGEVVVLAADGTTDFQALQNAVRAGTDNRLVYFLFDLPHCGGFDLSRTPLIDRKKLLSRLLPAAGNGPLHYNDHIATDGSAVLKQACQLKAEGIVSKRAASGYHAGRSSSWLKIKCRARQEFVVGGYSQASGSREQFGALLLGYYADGKLFYCGRVGSGFSQRSLYEIGNELEHHRQPHSPFTNLRRQRGVSWTTPALVAEVEFTGWTDDGVLRHAVFKGLRSDKSPGDVTREITLPSSRAIQAPDNVTRPSKTAAPSAGDSRSATVAGVRLSNPQRVLYPEQDITKLDLARYYKSVSDWILPALIHRPLSLVRCPQGRQAKCFYQRHHNVGTPAAVESIDIKEGSESVAYLYIRNLQGLISLVQLGVLEFHPWGARIDQIDRPDQIVLDFDPGEDVAWQRVIEAATRMRDLLADLGLASFVRTTGGKGLHVVVPLIRRSAWADVKSFARDAAERQVHLWPNDYLATASKRERHGKIYIDYLRNARSATSIGSYSTRARPGAPVATPLGWDELTAGVAPSQFNIVTVPERLRKLRVDPWLGFATAKQTLTKEIRKRIRTVGHSAVTDSRKLRRR
jgi:bifunctional non-homologous end joining protein LigD